MQVAASISARRALAVLASTLGLGLGPACDDAATTASDATTTSDATTADTSDTTAALVLTAAFDPAAAVGQNHLGITLVDGAGAGVAGATVTVEPTMPAMGHGSTETPVVSDDGAGHYTAFPVTLQMAGSWHIVVTATVGAEVATHAFDVTVQ